jgi:dTDP-glucose 4,6-dehydratase/UDP-glucuronate decarboxylase
MNRDVKRILITGGAGEIGSHLERKLIESGKYEVFIFDRERKTGKNYIRGDINDIFSVSRAFVVSKPDVVIHLAAMVSRKECEETPALAIETNGIGTLNVVKLCMLHHAYLIYSGSSEEYGEAFYGGERVNEETPFGTPTSVYAMTKRFSEEIIQYYAEHDGLYACTVRFFMLYSEHEPANDYRSAISRFCNAAIHDEKITVHAYTERSWCHIDDAIEGLIHIIERPPKMSYQTFLIGKDDPIDTLTLAQLIVDIFDSKSEISVVEKESTIIPIKRGDFSKMFGIYHWKANISLRDGLKRICRTYKK